MELGAFPAKGRGRGRGGKGDGGKNDRKCNYCNKPGHLWAECRNRLADEAAEAADGAKGKGRKGKKGKAAGATQRDVTCNYCRKKGHKEAQCRKKQEDQKPGGPLAATAQAAQSEPEPQPTVPIRALQLTEDEVQERFFTLEHGFLLPLPQAEAKVTQIRSRVGAD